MAGIVPAVETLSSLGSCLCIHCTYIDYITSYNDLALISQGEDLTTYGELCAECTFRAYGAKAVRHVFLFDKMVLITKKKEDGILCYKNHIMVSK
jgi:hypothetical protein